MIDSNRLLADLQKLLKELEADIRERLESQPERVAELDAEWRSARDARRTAATQFEWREERITQAGVHWILGTVFLRFLEDNRYLQRPFLFGPDAHTQALAIDRHARYFREHPDRSDREYLLDCFAEAAALPGLRGLFDPTHNPLYRLELTGDGAMALRDFWRRVDPDTGIVVHDFSDPAHGTRFLGDLYQDLSESARKRYALLQTPEFVEEFILDRTLTPAIESFGYRVVRLIDPTSGSGHFLLGAFKRLFVIWQREEPARNLPDLAQRALDAVYGVDLNPFAVEIARFRLLIAALNACGIEQLRNAPDFRINLAAGDSLLHGRRFGQLDLGGEVENLAARYAHAYETEDLADLNRILGQQYHAVVGNPPYITPKDSVLNEIYRSRYSTCHMKYSLGVPFTERFFDLAIVGASGRPAGFVGMITANSFMKREFGRKLIEDFLPRVDLTHVIDTSGAYIPGHGTPTVILFGRHRRPVESIVRTVMGIKGEPITPENPSHGVVWSAIVSKIDSAGSESEYVAIVDMPRIEFEKHPWSFGGGGAVEVKRTLDSHRTRLSALTESVGFASFPGTDDVFVGDEGRFRRQGFPSEFVKPIVTGEVVRDWRINFDSVAFAPYIDGSAPLPFDAGAAWARAMWPFRTTIGGVVSFGGKTRRDSGEPWWTWYRWIAGKYRVPLSITYAEVATHNHFALDRGGKVFKQTSPVIKLLPDEGEADHLAVTALLNSSVACFWLKQVSHQKQMMGGDGIRISEKSKVPYQFASTRVQEFPLPEGWAAHPLKGLLAELARSAEAFAQTIAEPRAGQVIERCLASGEDIASSWSDLLSSRSVARSKLIFIQEEIDFTCYESYGLTGGVSLRFEGKDWIPGQNLDAGARPFCMANQRNVDGFDVPAEVPADWPEVMRTVWARRMAAIRGVEALRVIEDSHYKRRWIGRQGLFSHDARTDEFADACKSWLLARLEADRYWPRSGAVPLRSIARLADLARTDDDLMQVAALYAGHDSFDIAVLVAELVEPEAVPHLPALRYTDEGLRKRAAWEQTWDLQRQEDATGVRLEVPVPPKYKLSDLRSGNYWRLRGPLDVPKERFVSYPGATLDADGTLVVTWAGYDHLQQAKALAGHYIDLKDNHGWGRERLMPLLAGLAELLPWLKHWHNEPDPALGDRMGNYFDGFVQDEARAMGVTLDELRTWRPQAPVRGRRRRT